MTGEPLDPAAAKFKREMASAKASAAGWREVAARRSEERDAALAEVDRLQGEAHALDGEWAKSVEQARVEGAAQALRAFADAHQMPWTMFHREDGRRVTIGDLLRGTADRYLRTGVIDGEPKRGESTVHADWCQGVHRGSRCLKPEESKLVALAVGQDQIVDAWREGWDSGHRAALSSEGAADQPRATLVDWCTKCPGTWSHLPSDCGCTCVDGDVPGEDDRTCPVHGLRCQATTITTTDEQGGVPGDLLVNCDGWGHDQGWHSGLIAGIGRRWAWTIEQPEPDEAVGADFRRSDR